MVLQIAEVPSNPIQKGCRAFTLLELLMASAAFAMIVLVMKVTLMGSLSLRNRSQERMDALNLRMRIMDIMEKDLRQCLLKETPFAQEFLGDSQGQGLTRNDQLTFYTASGVIQTNLPWGHLQKISYYLQQPLSGLQQEEEEGWALYREVTRNLAPAGGVEILMTPQPLARGVHSLAFQYYDGEYWQDTWDSSTEDPKLPLAVRIYLRFLPENSQENSQVLGADGSYPALQTIVPLMSVAQVEEDALETSENSNGDEDSSDAEGR